MNWHGSHDLEFTFLCHRVCVCKTPLVYSMSLYLSVMERAKIRSANACTSSTQLVHPFITVSHRPTCQAIDDKFRFSNLVIVMFSSPNAQLQTRLSFFISWRWWGSEKEITIEKQDTKLAGSEVCVPWNLCSLIRMRPTHSFSHAVQFQPSNLNMCMHKFRFVRALKLNVLQANITWNLYWQKSPNIIFVHKDIHVM